MNAAEAAEWIQGKTSGRSMFLDAAIKRGEMQADGGIVPPEVLVLIAQYDAAMTARACVIAGFRISEQAIRDASAQPPERFEWWAERVRQVEAERDHARQVAAQLRRERDETREQLDLEQAHSAARRERIEELESWIEEQDAELSLLRSLAETRLAAMEEQAAELNAIRELQVRTTLERDGLRASLEARGWDGVERRAQP